MTERKTVHESVLVGYFCQACGWIQRDIEARRPEKTGEPPDRLLRAVNLSHNPLDPAVGDLILQLDDNGTLPEKFFIFELKATWADRAAEQAKMLKKLGGDPATAERHKTKLLNDFPRAKNSHLFGGLTTVADGSRRFSVLLVGLYWDAIFSPDDVRSKSSVFHWLNAIVESKTTGGMAFEELAAYIKRLNSLAEVGGAAQAGASRFVVAYQDYQLYLLQEDAVRELVLARARKQERLLDQKRARQPDSSRDYGPR